MKVSAQLLLNFLFNGVWQIAVIALVAALADRFLRSTARLRHAVWVAAFVMALLLPLGSAISSLKTEPVAPLTRAATITEPVALMPASMIESTPEIVAPSDSSWHVAQRTAAILIAAFVLLVLYRSSKLFTAWIRTRRARRDAQEIEPGADVQAIVDQCRDIFGGARCRVFSSRSQRAPATVGVFRPLIILPEELLRDGDLSALTAAIGHEVVHVSRRDYLLNLIYEVIFLPVSFHPAAVFIKRRLIQTRELRCDELVAERLLHPDVYARSLVRLASWAMPFNRRTQTIVVGIADADILEVRIMSLLKKTKSTFRRNALLVIGAAILLAIPCLAAASFGFKFNIDPGLTAANAQEPSAEEKEKRENRLLRAKESYELNRKMVEAEVERLKRAIETTSNETERKKLSEQLRELVEVKEQATYTLTRDGKIYEARLSQEGQRKRELEEKYNTEMVRQAKISMDHAIQIATSKAPGQVLECTIVGERWSPDGEAAKPGLVLYRVVVLSGDEPPLRTFVWVNAADGSIYRTEKEERRKEREEEQSFERLPKRTPINGGVLNGKATSLPTPEYPLIARQAKASGTVNVEVLINEGGHVVAAHSVSGHPLLQAAAVAAARQATFAPTRLEGEPIMVRGVIVYSFATY